MIHFLVVDDEKPARQRLKKLLIKYSDFSLVDEAENGLQALNLINKHSPDVVFLDIEMPVLTGIQVAETLGVNGPSLIFVTAYDEYALKAFDSNAVDYIVKPINPDRLDFAIQKLQKSFHRISEDSLKAVSNQFQQKKTNQLALKIGNKYEVFETDKISVIRAADQYAELTILDKTYYSEESLESLEQRLSDTRFLRVHRSSIINVDFLKELRREGDRKYTAVLKDKKRSEIKISRERLPGLRELLGI